MENENRHDQSQDYDFVGENLGATLNYTVNFTSIVASWFENKKFYNYYTGTCTDADQDEDEDGEGCIPYTQVGQRTAAVLEFMTIISIVIVLHQTPKTNQKIGVTSSML